MGEGILARPTEALVGRDRDLLRMGKALEATLAGHRRSLLIAGEPGSGKTRLLRQIAGVAVARGERVLQVRARAAGGSPCLWPWAQMLRSYLREVDQADLVEHLGEGGAVEIAQLVPELRSRVPDLDGAAAGPTATDDFRLFEAISSLFVVAARRQPLVLVIDDLQSLSAASLALLEQVIEETVYASMFVVVAYSATEPARNRQLTKTLAALVRSPGTEVLELKPLDRSAVGELVTQIAGTSICNEMISALHACTAGNPFLVTEMARWMTEERRLDVSGALEGELGLPPSIITVAWARLGQLSENGQRVLATAALLRNGFRPALLGGVTDLSNGLVLDALDEAVEAGLIHSTSDGSFAFTHSLMRQAIERKTPPNRRARLHLELAKSMGRTARSDEPVPAAALAHHFAEAAEGGIVEAFAQAVAFSMLAAEHELAAGDAAGGVVHVERALRIACRSSTSNHERPQVLLELGRFHRRAGDWAKAAAAFRESASLAKEAGDWVHVGEAMLAWAGVTDSAWIVEEESVALVEAAISHLCGAQPSLVAQLLTARARLSGETRQARVAEDLARKLDDATALYDALDARLSIEAGLRGRDRLELADELAELAVARADRRHEAHAEQLRAAARLELGDVDGWRSSIARLQHLVADDHLDAQAHTPLLIEMMWGLVEGRFDEIEKMAQRVVQAAGANPLAGKVLITHQFLAHRERGRSADLDALGEPSGATAQGTLADAVRALHCVDRGQRDEARRILEEVVEHPLHDTWTLAVLAETCSALEHDLVAARLYPALARHAGCVVTMADTLACAGSVDRYLGMLATTMKRWNTARTHFDAAVQLDTRLGARPALARTQLELAKMLRREARPAMRPWANDLLSQATNTAEDLGMVLLARQIQDERAELHADGVRSATSTVAPASVPLTPRELDVLREVVLGRSNKQIARELGISDKTAKTHLGNIFAKLNLTDRTQAAVYAIMHSLVIGEAEATSSDLDDLSPDVRPLAAGRLRPMADARDSHRA